MEFEKEEEIQELQKEIIEKKTKLEELLGRRLVYTKKGNIDMRSLRMNTENQENFKKMTKEKNEKLKKARLQELEAALDKTLEKTLNNVIERKMESVNKVQSREPTPTHIRPNSF